MTASPPDTPTTNTPKRPSKKSETLEVRLPYETKRNFLDACRQDGTTASEVVRGSIDDYLEHRRQPETASPRSGLQTGRLIDMIPQPVRRKRYLAGALGALGLAAVFAMPSAAGPDFKAAFNRLDANKDGVLTAEEFLGERKGGDEIIVVRRKAAGDGTEKVEPLPPGLTEKSVTYWLEDPAGKPGAEGGEVRLERREIRMIRKDGQSGEAAPLPDLRLEDFSRREFGNFDGDKDGKVSFAEYTARQREMLVTGFRDLDRDKDGFLVEAEYQHIGAPLDRLPPEVDASLEADALTVDIKGAVRTVAPEKLKASFQGRDANRDGKLSLEEYLPKE